MTTASQDTITALARIYGFDAEEARALLSGHSLTAAEQEQEDAFFQRQVHKALPCLMPISDLYNTAVQSETERKAHERALKASEKAKKDAQKQQKADEKAQKALLKDLKAAVKAKKAAEKAQKDKLKAAEKAKKDKLYLAAQKLKSAEKAKKDKEKAKKAS